MGSTRIRIKKIETYFISKAQDPNKELLHEGPVTPVNQIEISGPATEEWRKDLIDRLHYFRFPLDSTKHRTTYDRLDEIGLLDEFLHGPLFNEIRLSFAVGESIIADEKLKKHELSPSGYKCEFHRKMAHLLFNNVERVHHLVEEYGVSPAWVVPYLRAAEMQLIWEVKKIPGWLLAFPYLIKYHLTNIASDMRLDIYDILLARLSRHGVKKGAKSLAEHLTAVVCSSSRWRKTGELVPSPGAIKKLVAAHRIGSKK